MNNVTGSVAAAVKRGPPRKSGPMPRPPASAASGQGPVKIDAGFITYRLEEAGATLLALPGTGYSPRMRVSRLDIPADAVEGMSGGGRIRPPVPSASRITRMDEALGWILLIPEDRYVLRRIVGARSLVSPVTERHLYSWRRIGQLIGADHKAVQRWHGQAVDMITAAVWALHSTAARAAV